MAVLRSKRLVVVVAVAGLMAPGCANDGNDAQEASTPEEVGQVEEVGEPIDTVGAAPEEQPTAEESPAQDSSGDETGSK